MLAAIDSLLFQQPITSEHLTTFRLQHPDVVGGQQGSKEDLSLLTADSDDLSDSVLLCDSVNVSVADTESVADTNTCSTIEHNVSCTAVTRRHHSHRLEVVTVVIITVTIIISSIIPSIHSTDPPLRL